MWGTPLLCPPQGPHCQGGCLWQCRTPCFWVRVMPAGLWLWQWGCPYGGMAMEWGWPGKGCPMGKLGCPTVWGPAWDSLCGSRAWAGCPGGHLQPWGPHHGAALGVVLGCSAGGECAVGLCRGQKPVMCLLAVGSCHGLCRGAVPWGLCCGVVPWVNAVGLCRGLCCGLLCCGQAVEPCHGLCRAVHAVGPCCA